MNHLEEAKRLAKPTNPLEAITDRENERAKTHALIAIAEQLEKMNRKPENEWYCSKCLDIHYDSCPKEDK